MELSFVDRPTRYVLGWWRAMHDWWCRDTRPSLLLPRPLAVSTALVTVPRVSQRRDNTDVTWQFKRDILERLDDYFHCVHRLRRYDPDAYAYYSRVGFMVPANYAHRTNPVVPDGIRMGKGGVLGPLPDSDDVVTPAFMYLERIARPVKVQAFRGDVYLFTTMYDDRRQHHGHRYNYPCQCYLGVSADGQVRLLKQLVARHDIIRPKRGRQAIQRASTTWGFPLWVNSLGADTATGVAPHTRVAQWFVMTYVTHARATDRIVVQVVKGATAAFGIDLQTAKTFFRDRDKTEVSTAVDGKRKRIFHSVRTHSRRLATGASTVRAHYRGIRLFDWNGYGIRIVLPHLSALMRMDVTGVESETPQPGMLNTHQLAAAVGEMLEA